MAGIVLTPYLPATNKYQGVYAGIDGWMYSDIRTITSQQFGSTSSSPTSIAHFEPYLYKGVVYLKFCTWGSQGYDGYYLSVDRNGNLGLYNWMGATGWKLDSEGHLVSLYNGCSVGITTADNNRYKADSSLPGLRFKQEDNRDLWVAMIAAYGSPVTSLATVRTQTWGGTGGKTIFGGAVPSGVSQLLRINLHVGDQINVISPSWCNSSGGNIQSFSYGGPGQNAGVWREFSLALGEQITEVQGRADTVIRQLTFKTNKGNTFGPFGPATGTAFSVTGNPIIGFFGYGGWAIDKLGFIQLASLPTTRTLAYGGTGGGAFDGTPAPGVTGIMKMAINAGSQINTINVDWCDPGGWGRQKATFGGSGQYPGTWSEFLLQADEYLTEVSGKADSVVRQLTFKTNKGNTFGPYGTAAGTAFSVTGKTIVGFFGRGGWAIDQLGFVVLVPPVPKASTALEFNGVDTYVELNAPLPLGPQVTLEMWARGAPKEAHLFWLTDDALRRQFSAHVPWSDGNIYFDAAADANNNYDRIVKTASPHDPSAWNHWAFVRNTTTGRMAIYKNGDLFYDATGATRPMASCNRFFLGADGNGTGRHAGAISEVRLWNVERTATQIKDNMNRVIQGPDTGLVLSWSLDEYQAGQPIMDGSGSSRHGTLKGTTTTVTPPPALAK